jgi:hypothetical protein
MKDERRKRMMRAQRQRQGGVWGDEVAASCLEAVSAPATGSTRLDQASPLRRCIIFLGYKRIAKKTVHRGELYKVVVYMRLACYCFPRYLQNSKAEGIAITSG